MAEASKEDLAKRKCPQCGAELPANQPPELCPRCLLLAGLGTQPVAGPEGTAVLPAAKASARGLPQPGDKFGHYRIVRLLGAGGMGAAFEADDLETGRHVALKVLSHTLDSPDARERFFREGRLAASINHPNSVYVFGTEEIAGTPVIAMELMSGGTLQDRVNARGPVPVGEAVDAVLQIIAGLEAAQRIGILHRDVKPSNCFRDADGTVKIGDFGLSISTAVRTEPALTSAGEFLGTPAFCSPEQLRGDELNARSDMYSVGATLFYLLTGRTPFDGKHVVQLLATVLEQPTPSPRKFRPELPPTLARIIVRCLEKQPGERFKNYQDLARALTPYGSAAPTPATLGLRFVAGVVDHLILSAVFMLCLLPQLDDWEGFGNLTRLNSSTAAILALAGFSSMLFYFSVFEGFWGFTAGKALCRLRVVRPDKSPPGFPRALLRAAIYVGLPVLPYWLFFGFNFKAYLSSTLPVQYSMSFLFYALLALLFCTARRRNGFAAWQDLATNTRVIARAALVSRPVMATIELPAAATQGGIMVGPYHVLETLEKSAHEEWLLGYDLRLLRKVWIRTAPPGTPAVPATLRNIGRVGRLRWLAGRRTPEENWDAFEAANGKPLLALILTRQPWGRVRFWLHDLATEISAAEKDGTLPPVLALDRVWITADGRAKLLDFPAPGVAAGILPPRQSPENSAHFELPPVRPPSVTPGVTDFLGAVAAASLAGWREASPESVGKVPVPLPLHARAFLKTLPQLSGAAGVIAALESLLAKAAEVSRLRRAAVVAGCLAFPTMAGIGIFFGFKMLDQWQRTNPGVMELGQLLQQRSAMRFWNKNARGPTDRQLAIHIASHYRATITNEAVWSSTFALAMIKGEARAFAERSLVEHAAPTEKEIADAGAAVTPFLPNRNLFATVRQPSLPLVILSITLGVYVAVPALLAAAAFRGGLVLLLAGVTFVRRDGIRASRLRVFWRGLLTWSPLLLGLVIVILSHKPAGDLLAAVLASLPIAGLTLVSLLLPKRGLADRLAGTWPVPR